MLPTIKVESDKNLLLFDFVGSLFLFALRACRHRSQLVKIYSYTTHQNR